MNEAITTTLADLAPLLRLRGLRFALIGGLAVGVRGEPRFTRDVDLVLAAEVDDAVSLAGGLSGSPFDVLFDGAEEVLRQAFILPLVHRATGTIVDVAVGLSGFERTAVKRATEETVLGTTLPVVTAEDLLLMKVLAGRPRDVEDARHIAARLGPRLDWGYVIRTADQLGEALGQDLGAPLRALRANTPP